MALAAEIKCLHCQRYGGEKPRKAAQAINNMFWMPSEDWLKCFPLRSANIYQNARFRQRLSVCLRDVFLRSARCERYDMNWKLQWNVDKIINHDMCSSLSLFSAITTTPGSRAINRSYCTVSCRISSTFSNSWNVLFAWRLVICVNNIDFQWWKLLAKSF